MLQANFEIKIIAIAAEGLTEEYLGKTYDLNMLEDLKQKNKQFGLHVAGEGGEFESFVTNAPLFKKKLVIKEASPVMDTKNSGYLDIKEVEIHTKDF